MRPDMADLPLAKQAPPPEHGLLNNGPASGKATG